MSVFAAIDLKSFYASVECVERGLDPLTTHLVVADPSRTDKTICLAVSPSLKAHGIPSRPRLFEVIAGVGEVNSKRRWEAPGRSLVGATFDERILEGDKRLALDYIVAPPRMQLYMDYSTRIYGIYLKYFAPEDIHVYSIDEVFIDMTHYLKTYKASPRELLRRVIGDVLSESGITATAGIGENLYLAKVAMDIVAKRLRADKDGVRIAELSEAGYRRMLWEHRPLTDFWRVGVGYMKRLESHGMFTMGDVALMSQKNEELLYKLFGVNAELLIDHAWGHESCTMESIKSYTPTSESLSSGQVLSRPYSFDEARIIVREMSDSLSLDLVERELVTEKLTLTVSYDRESLDGGYAGALTLDHYGRVVPRHAHGTASLMSPGSSSREIIDAIQKLYCEIVDPTLLIRRVNVTATGLMRADKCRRQRTSRQLDIFSDPEALDAEDERYEREYEREKRRQRAIISIKRKHGGNAILRGVSFEEGATAIDRNMQIGGHKA